VYEEEDYEEILTAKAGDEYFFDELGAVDTED
jgi:hypothetical protein